MKRILITLLAALLLSAPRLSAQMGFDFGMNYEFMNRKVPSGFKSSAFGMGPYIGLIYGIPVSMSNMVNIGVNYKYDFIWGAMGAWDDESKLDPITLLNTDTNIREQHIQVPVTFNHEMGGFNLSVGPVFDYCLSSTISSTDKDWPFVDTDGHGKTMDNLKDFDIKPFNVYLKAGAGVGMKGFSFNITGAYGLFDLSPDDNPLHRWTVGLDFHLIL